MKPRFATALHPETLATTKPREQIAFVGHSYPHAAQIRNSLAAHTGSYPTLPLRSADIGTFGSVHSSVYLQQL